MVIYKAIDIVRRSEGLFAFQGYHAELCEYSQKAGNSV